MQKKKGPKKATWPWSRFGIRVHPSIRGLLYYRVRGGNIMTRTERRTKPSGSLYRILKWEKDKANTVKIIIQYPGNVILNVLALISGDCFTGEQAEVGKWDLRSWMRVHHHLCDKPLQVKASCWPTPREHLQYRYVTEEEIYKDQFYYFLSICL